MNIIETNGITYLEEFVDKVGDEGVNDLTEYYSMFENDRDDAVETLGYILDAVGDYLYD